MRTTIACSPAVTIGLLAGAMMTVQAEAAANAQDTATRPATPPVATAEHNTLTSAERAAGWTLLFDGTSTEHFRGYRQDGFPESGWTIDNGALKVASGGGDIVTRQQYSDFELSLEYRCAPRANSGIMYRVGEQHSYSWQTGPEFQILDDAGHGFANTHIHSAGGVYDLYAPSENKVHKPAGEYNRARIRVKDGIVQHFLNGMKIVEFDMNSEEWKEKIAASKFRGYEGFGVLSAGHICLQDHGDDVWFRNIKVRDLTKPMPGEVRLFNGRDLTGWSTYFRGGESSPETFRVDNGVMICTGQPIGYIQTDEEYTNYVLKLEWRFDPEKGAGNSGVLLRKIGEETVWPKCVEAQLHSGNAGDFWNIGEFEMKTDPDRTRGRNTRKTHDAERALGVWNTYEIIVDGGDIKLIVNGEKLNHAWDVTEVPGRIALQSEGAEIHFRNIRLAPIDR